MTKYIKLSNDHKELKSALYAQKPRQIQRLPDDAIHYHDWFIVDEIFPNESKNMNLYELVRDSWEVDRDRVKFYYRYELRAVEYRRQYVVDQINNYRAHVLTKKIIFDGEEYDRDDKSIIRISGATIMAISDPTYKVEWIKADNEPIILTAEQVVKLGKAQAGYESAVITFARKLKDRVLLSDDPESIDYTTIDWPSNVYSSADM